MFTGQNVHGESCLMEGNVHGESCFMEGNVHRANCPNRQIVPRVEWSHRGKLCQENELIHESNGIK